MTCGLYKPDISTSEITACKEWIKASDQFDNQLWLTMNKTVCGQLTT